MGKPNHAVHRGPDSRPGHHSVSLPPPQPHLRSVSVSRLGQAKKKRRAMLPADFGRGALSNGRPYSVPAFFAAVHMSPCGRFCCKSRKLPGDNFPAITRTNRRPPLCVASITLPRSPVSLSSGDEIPHIFTRKSRLQPGEFLITSAKRLLQQNRHKVDIPRRSAVCPLLGVKRTWDFARSRSSPPLVTRMRHQKRIFAVMHNSAIW
jgi:hypothetical protein